MVLIISGIGVEELPASLPQLFSLYPPLKIEAKRLVESGVQIVSSGSSLLVAQREFAATTPNDSSVQVLGTDNIIHHVALIIRHLGSGATLLSQVDRITENDLISMINKVSTQAADTGFGDHRLQVQIVGGFEDRRGFSQRIVLNLLGVLQNSPERLELTGLCVGEVATVFRGGTQYPAIQGVGINVKTGIVFPATFMDRGPDMDIRLARTLTGGEGVGMLDIYSPEREELRIGPFSYLPMRSVDIWINQSDDFILQSLTPCPEVIADREAFVRQVRDTLRLVKAHPYPSVTIFQANASRIYRRDHLSGEWLSKYQQPDWCRPGGMKNEPLHFNFCVKQESFIPWNQLGHAAYY